MAEWHGTGGIQCFLTVVLLWIGSTIAPSVLNCPCMQRMTSLLLARPFITTQNNQERTISLHQKFLETDSQALLYGTSITFMAHACVPEVSDNVASVLFSQNGGRIPRSLQTSSQTMFGGTKQEKTDDY